MRMTIAARQLAFDTHMPATTESLLIHAGQSSSATAGMADNSSGEPAQHPPAAEVKPVDLQFDTTAADTETSSMAQQGSMSQSGQSMQTGISALAGRMRDNANVILETKKPWAEFCDRTAMSKPGSMGDVTTRLQKNLSYYRTNYFIVFLATMAVVFLLHPLALVWVSVLTVIWCWLFLVAPGPLTIGGREYSDREKVIGAAVVSFVVIFFLTNVATMALYGVSITLGATALHASFKEPDDLFLDNPDQSNHLFSNNMFKNVPTLQQAPGQQMV